MFDFEDELAVGSYKISWLIWIQLLLMLLLIALLHFFSTFALDPSDETATATVAIASTSATRLVLSDIQHGEKPVAKHHSTATVVINTQGGEKLKTGETATGASRKIVSQEEIAEEEEEEALHFHPCHYFNIARLFLKCLGLDPKSDSPSTKKRRKRKQS